MRAPSRPAFSYHRLTITDALLAVLVGVMGLGLYIRTLVDFVLPHDSGELQVLVQQLGTTHTTGYSTYLFLAHAFTRLLPVGDIAYRVNLFSAVMAALTLALIYVTGRLVSGSRSAGVFAAAALSVSFTFWSQAIIAEVYTTGAAFLAAVLLLVILWYLTSRRRAIVLAGLVGGAGLGAHGSVAIFGAAVVIFLLLNGHRWREWLVPGTGGAVIGLGLYFGGTFLIDANNAPANIFRVSHIPNRSHLGLTAMAVNDPVDRVMFVISAGNWRSAMFPNPLLDTPRWLLEYLRNLPRDILLPTLALAAFGLVRLVRRDSRLAALLWVSLALQLFFYCNYDVGRARFVFYIPSYMLLVLLAANGFAELERGIFRQAWSAKPVRVAAALLVALACVWPLLWSQWGAVRNGEVAFLEVDDSLVHRTSAELGERARSTTSVLPDNAIVFADWARLWPYCYTAHIEQGKTGSWFINLYPYTARVGLAASIIELVHENIAQRPIYLASRYPEFADAGYALRPVQMGATRMWQVQEGNGSAAQAGAASLAP